MNGHPDTATAIAALAHAKKAIAIAEAALRGQGGTALLISSEPVCGAIAEYTRVTCELPAGHTNDPAGHEDWHRAGQIVWPQDDLATAEASPGNPYGSSLDAVIREGLAAAERGETEDLGDFTQYAEAKHGRYDAASAAGVAEGAEPPVCRHCGSALEGCCNDDDPDRLGAGYTGMGNASHFCDGMGDQAHEPASPLLSPLCPAQWGEPPETMLCSLTSGHDGNHATAEHIEWGGRWETAEPGAKDGGAEPLRISPETIAEARRVGSEWPDGMHTCAELQALEPGRRPCTCGRCHPGAKGGA